MNLILKSCSDKHERSVGNRDFEKKEIAKHFWEADHNFSWDQQKIVDREIRLIPGKIKETITVKLYCLITSINRIG